MPTLFRLLTIVAILAALVYGAMWALATFVTPTQGEMTIRIPSGKISPTNGDLPDEEPVQQPDKPVAGD